MHSSLQRSPWTVPQEKRLTSANPGDTCGGGTGGTAEREGGGGERGDERVRGRCVGSRGGWICATESTCTRASGLISEPRAGFARAEMI